MTGEQLARLTPDLMRALGVEPSPEDLGRMGVLLARRTPQRLPLRAAEPLAGVHLARWHGTVRRP